MKYLLAILLSVTFVLGTRAFAEQLDESNVEDLYSLSLEMPGDGGEGGGACLVRIEAEDVYDDVAIYPYSSPVFNFFWSMSHLDKRPYVEASRHMPKYSTVRAIMLYDIYKYQDNNGKAYEAKDIFFYYINKVDVINYLYSGKSRSGDSLMSFSLDNLYAFEMSDGTIVYRSDLKTVFYKK